MRVYLFCIRVIAVIAAALKHSAAPAPSVFSLDYSAMDLPNQRGKPSMVMPGLIFFCLNHPRFISSA
jgi:hypothetical protein